MSDEPSYKVLKKVDDKNVMIQLEDGTELVVRLNRDGTMDARGTKMSEVKTIPETVLERQLAMIDEVKRLSTCDLKDPDDVDYHCREYFALCNEYSLTPTVSGLGFAVGLDRRRVCEAAAMDDSTLRNRMTKESMETLGDYYRMMSVMYETNLAEEKGNPTKWIFLGKNNYGYRDNVEPPVMLLSPIGELPDSEDVAKKYLQGIGKY